VANIEGKGRDDLSFDILDAAEKIINQVTDQESKAARKIAFQIRDVFLSIRKLFQEYEQNIGILSPISFLLIIINSNL
jgi:hypothetical protein